MKRSQDSMKLFRVSLVWSALSFFFAMPRALFAVNVTYDDMQYLPVNYGNYDTRLYSSASDFLTENYITLDPLGPDTIQDNRGSIDQEETEEANLVDARTFLGASPPIPAIRAKAQTDFFLSRTFTDSVRSGDYSSISGLYSASNRNGVQTESTWIDEWSFNVDGWVEIEVKFEARIYLNPFSPGNFIFTEFEINPASNNLGVYGLDSIDLDGWDFDFDAKFGVFDRDTLVECPDCDSSEPVPLNVGSVTVVATSDFEVIPNGGGVIPSADRLAIMAGEEVVIDRSEVIRFFAIAGHAYHIINDVRNDSFDGITVDAFNTIALQVVRTEPGMVLQSRAVQDLGASLNVQTIPEISGFWLLSACGVSVLALRRAARRK